MYRFTFIFLLLISSNCKAQNNAKEIDKSDYAIITHTIGDSVFVNSKSVDLSYNEILNIEKILKLELGRKLKKHKYFRQYIAVENENNKKIVWVNFLCKKYYEPTLENRIANPGNGDCFFELKVNLTDKNIFDFREK